MELSPFKSGSNGVGHVFVQDSLTLDQLAVLRRALPEDRFVVNFPASGEPSLPTHRLAIVDYLVVREARIDKKLLASAPRLQLIVKLSSRRRFAVDDVAAKRRGIVVQFVDSPDLVNVAEHALMLMLVLAKELFRAHRGVVEGAYDGRLTPTLTTQTTIAFNWLGLNRYDVMYGKTLGLVGFGTIARLLAERARAFGMVILYNKRYRLRPAEERALGVEYRSLDDLLPLSDFVSLHLRFYPETEEMMGARQFGLMKPTAYLINTARGRLIDEEALYNALQNRQIAGAGLDVFQEEPLPHGHPFTSLDNVVFTPHSAGLPLNRSSSNELAEAARRIAMFARTV